MRTFRLAAVFAAFALMASSACARTPASDGTIHPVLYVARDADSTARLTLEVRRLKSALAHEMTHVVIAERIDRGRIPAWADEGMAVLADMPEKQSLHAADLRQGLRSRTTFRVVELLNLAAYPAPARIGVFYGQSGALVSFLVGRGTPAQFVRFIERAIDHGYDRALRETYQIDGVAQLEQIWRKSLRIGELRFASHVVDRYWSPAATRGGELKTAGG